jgi:hypothetical protein
MKLTIPRQHVQTTVLCALLCNVLSLHAQQATPAAGGEQDLQKATQNPVASLISVPLQNNSTSESDPIAAYRT